MTKRLWIIIAVGVIAIGLTWFLMNKPEPDPTEDPAYKEQLAKLRQKQAEKKKEKEGGGATENNGAPSAGGEPGKSGEGASGAGADDASGKTPGPSGNAGDSLKQMQPLRVSEKAKLIQSAVAEQKVAPAKNNQKAESIKSAPSNLPTGKEMAAAPEVAAKSPFKSSADRLSYLASLPAPVIEPTDRAWAQAQTRLELSGGSADGSSPAMAKIPLRNPFAPLLNKKPFPRSGALAKKDKSVAASNSKGEDRLPPPPDMNVPPQPVPSSDEIASGLSVDELPPPPEKPMLIPRMRLNAILDDRVIMTFPDGKFSRANGFKKFITLAPGQSYDSIKLLDVEANKATFEEFGQVKTVVIDPIR